MEYLWSGILEKIYGLWCIWPHSYNHLEHPRYLRLHWSGVLFGFLATHNGSLKQWTGVQCLWSSASPGILLFKYYKRDEPSSVKWHLSEFCDNSNPLTTDDSVNQDFLWKEYIQLTLFQGTHCHRDSHPILTYFVSFRGAFHHVRCMTNTNYAPKIFLFRLQLDLTDREKRKRSPVVFEHLSHSLNSAPMQWSRFELH